MLKFYQKDSQKEWLQRFHKTLRRMRRCPRRQKQKRINHLPTCWFTHFTNHLERKLQGFCPGLLKQLEESPRSRGKKVQGKQKRKERKLHHWVQESQRISSIVLPRKRTVMHWEVFWSSWGIIQGKDLLKGIDWILQPMEKGAWSWGFVRLWYWSCPRERSPARSWDNVNRNPCECLQSGFRRSSFFMCWMAQKELNNPSNPNSLLVINIEVLF